MTFTDPARTRRDDIKAIRTTRKAYSLAPHQYWCETCHAFEIWQPIDGQNQMLECIPRKSVVSIHIVSTYKKIYMEKSNE